MHWIIQDLKSQRSNKYYEVRKKIVDKIAKLQEDFNKNGGEQNHMIIRARIDQLHEVLGWMPEIKI